MGKLKELAKLTTGYTAREKNNTPTDCFELNSLKSLIIDPEDKRSYTFQGKDIFPYLLNKHDIVIETRGAFKVGIILKECSNLTINANQIKVRIIDNLIIPEYLCHYLNSIIVKNELKRLKKGSSTLHISLTDLGSLDIPVLPLKKQKKAIEAINKVHYYIELNKKALGLYEQIPTALFQKLIKEEQCTK